MTHSKTNYTEQNGYLLNQEFQQFMEGSVIPATKLSNSQFWNVFTSTLDATDENSNLQCASHSIQKTELEVPLGDASLTMNTINSRWGSLYDVLYTDNTSTQIDDLRSNQRIDIPRRDRVIHCAKDFLDKTFPLTEGSHHDAVSYMVYFQNLLIILADGSTTGLQKPRQFTGKNGPTNEPESILLKHSGMHAEVIFDRNGKIGQHDLANIDDIQLEAANHTLLKFEATSASEKCATYKNWFDLVNANINNKTFSANDGEVFVANQDNWSIKLSDNGTPCELVLSESGTPVAEATIDAIVAALIYSNGRQGIAHLNMYVANDVGGINDSLISKLGALLAVSRTGICPLASETEKNAAIKVLRNTADTPAPGLAAQSFAQTPTPQTAVMGALESHGFDIRTTQL